MGGKLHLSVDCASREPFHHVGRSLLLLASSNIEGKKKSSVCQSQVRLLEDTKKEMRQGEITGVGRERENPLPGLSLKRPLTSIKTPIRRRKRENLSSFGEAGSASRRSKRKKGQ